MLRLKHVQNSRLSRALRSSISYSIVIGLINFTAQIIYARKLGVSVVSVYAQILIVAQIVGLALSTSVNHAVISLGAKPHLIRAGWALQLGILVVAISLLMLVTFAVDRIMPDSFLAQESGFIWMSLLGNLALLPAYIMNIDMEYNLRYGKQYTMRFLSVLFANGCGIFLSLHASSALPMVCRDMVFGFSYLTISAAMTKPDMRRNFVAVLSGYTWGDILRVARLTKSNWSINILGAAVIRLDYWLVALLLGQSFIGIYYQMRALVEGFLAVGLGSIQSVLFSFFSTRRTDSGWSIVAHTIVAAFVLAAVGIGLVEALGTPVIDLLLGAQWTPGVPALIGLSAYAVFRSAIEVFVSFAKSRELQSTVIRAQLGWLAGELAITPVLVYSYGLFGAGCASALCAGLVVFYLNYRLKSIVAAKAIAA